MSRLLETQFRGHSWAGRESWPPCLLTGPEEDVCRAASPVKASGSEDGETSARGVGRILPRLGTRVTVGLGLSWEGLNLVGVPQPGSWFSQLLLSHRHLTF